MNRCRALLVVATTALLAASGCDKLKSLAGKGDADGGAASSGGGGLLSFGATELEGEVTLTMQGKGQSAPTTMVLGIKKPKLRVDAKNGMPTAGGGMGLGSGGVVILVDPPQKKAWALQPAEKRAVLFDFETMKNAPSVPGMPGLPGAKPAKPGTPPKIEKLGKKDTVAGYACETWLITQEDGRKADVCVAEGLTWVDLSDISPTSPELVAAAALGANRFPLRVIASDPQGVVEARIEATKIEKKKLDDASFVVPPDYQVTDLAAMMQGLGGLGGIPGQRPGAVPAMPKTR